MSEKSGTIDSSGRTLACVSRLFSEPICGWFTATTAAAIEPAMATENWKKSVHNTPVNPPIML